MEQVPADKPGISILYAEDDFISREIVTAILKLKFPCATVHCAENGKMGLELFREVKPDIVMTDINMPVMDGLRLAEEINSIDARIPIIFVTAYGDLVGQGSAPGDGANYYVTKPIDQKRLFAILEQCLAVKHPGGVAEPS